MPRSHSRRHTRRPLCILLALVGLAALPAGLSSLLQPVAHAAATFNINSTGDGPDSNLGDGTCNDGSGNCTLRAAIEQANALAGSDTLNFSVTGTINLNGARLDQNAGGVLTTSEKSELVASLAPAPSDATKRAQVLRSVAESEALARAESNRAFVLMQYFGYLRRNPSDAPERDLDYTGYDFWLSKLDEFNGNFIQAEMVKAFLDSDEYRKRFGQ